MHLRPGVDPLLTSASSDLASPSGLWLCSHGGAHPQSPPQPPAPPLVMICSHASPRRAHTVLPQSHSRATPQAQREINPRTSTSSSSKLKP